MTDQLLNALKLLLLGLIYLFFGRVLWAVWSEVRTPVAVGGGAARRSSKKVSRGVVSFVVIEPKEHRGQTYTLSNVLNIGRVEDNDIVITDDSFISSHHARIEVRPEGVWVVDLQSTNGTKVNGVLVHGEQLLQHGDVISLGTAQLTFEAS